MPCEMRSFRTEPFPQAGRRAAAPPSARCSGRGGENGFTLVELIVVIAIIAMLLAIMTPSYSKAVATARLTVCASNLRQIGVAGLNYLNDNFKVYPAKKNGTMYSWVGHAGTVSGYDKTKLGADARVFNPYLGTFKADSPLPIADCPCDTGAELGKGIPASQAQGTSYGSNTNQLLPSLEIPVAGGSTRGIGLSQIHSPTRMVVMGEDPAYAAVWWSQGDWQSKATTGYYWHGPLSRWNLQFADGHVGFVEVTNPLRTGADYTFDRDQ